MRQDAVPAVPPHHALYGGGLLRFWSGHLYGRVMASRESPASREQVLAIARSIVKGRPANGRPPESSRRCRVRLGERFVLRPDRTCFFRSHYVLNSVHYVAPDDILGLNPAVDAVIGEYRAPQGGGPVRLDCHRVSVARCGRRWARGVPEVRTCREPAAQAAGRPVPSAARARGRVVRLGGTGSTSRHRARRARRGRGEGNWPAPPWRRSSGSKELSVMSNDHEITRRDFVRTRGWGRRRRRGACRRGRGRCGRPGSGGGPARPLGPRGDRARRAGAQRHARCRHGRARPHAGRHRHACDRREDAESRVARALQAADTVGLVPTPHLNPTHPELVDAVRRALVGAGIPPAQIREAQGGIELPRACTALIAMPALKAHWLTGIGTVLKNYIMYSGRPSSYHDANNANLGEIWLLPDVKGKTRLVLVDALRPLCDKGPQPDPRYLLGLQRAHRQHRPRRSGRGRAADHHGEAAGAARGGVAALAAAALRERGGREVRPRHEPHERDHAGPRRLAARHPRLTGPPKP